MTNGKDSKFAMYELYLGTAEKVSDRRAQANSWMLSVNSGIVALQGCLQSVSAALPVAGLIICVAWAALLKSYREINRAKFAVLSELEADLPASPITSELQIYKEEGRRSLSQVESLLRDAEGLLVSQHARRAARGEVTLSRLSRASTTIVLSPLSLRF